MMDSVRVTPPDRTMQNIELIAATPSLGMESRLGHVA